MPKVDLVSILVASANPRRQRSRSVLSARKQSHTAIEIIEVEQSATARNAAIRASHGQYIVSVTAGDELKRNYVSHCLQALETSPELAFVYTDSQIKEKEYNLFELLDDNIVPPTVLLRKQDWLEAGGYAEWVTPGNVDWELWLRLGFRGRFGQRLDKSLIRYYNRPANRSQLPTEIRLHHPELNSYETRCRIKRHWSPAVTLVGVSAANQTILDCDSVQSAGEREGSRAPAFL